MKPQNHKGKGCYLDYFTGKTQTKKPKKYNPPEPPKN